MPQHSYTDMTQARMSQARCQEHLQIWRYILYAPHPLPPNADSPQKIIFGRPLPLIVMIWDNPPFPAFFMALMIYYLAIAEFFETFKEDLLQTPLALAGLLFGYYLGFRFAPPYNEGKFFVKSFVPISVLGAVVLSALLHRLCFWCFHVRSARNIKNAKPPV